MFVGVVEGVAVGEVVEVGDDVGDGFGGAG